MQIASIPPPIITNAVPQDVAAKAVPVMQAVAPLVQNPVVPTAKSDKFSDKPGHKDGRRRDERAETKKEEGSNEDERGSSLNISI